MAHPNGTQTLHAAFSLGNKAQIYLTLSVPHFSDSCKNDSTKAFSTILVQPTLSNFLTFGHSGALDLRSNVTKYYSL